MIEEKRALAKLPAPSGSFRSEPQFAVPAGQVQLTYEYGGPGDWVRGGLVFTGACAYRHRGESRCTPWHVEGVYDTLVEVVPSDWISELDAVFDEHQAGMPRRGLHHFMIYVDSAGSYEVAAAEWSWLPETLVE